MYLNLTEKIMVEKIQSLEGWSKSNTDNNSRIICIGNIKNCNDEIIQNMNIKNEIINLLNKYDITDYEIRNIKNEYEFSYLLSMEEKNYNILKEKIKH